MSIGPGATEFRNLAAAILFAGFSLLLTGCGSVEQISNVQATSSVQASQLIASCLTEHGWPATASGGSFTTGTISADQVDAYDKVVSECSQGVMPDVAKFDESDWNALYANVTSAVECLAENGLVVRNVPSMQTYRQGNASWSVYQELIDEGLIKPADVESLTSKCPQPSYWPGE